MVYFHGGNYKQGYGAGELYFGDKLAAQTNTIIVSTNYRLGALGYFAAPELGIPGNLGVHDQRLSLQWVQQNIGAFGGDVDNVTIFGQSAGAGSVAVHMTSPKSRGLFHRAWLLSNPFGIPLRSPKSAPAIRDVFLKNTNCQDLACLRALNVDDLVDAQKASETDSNAMGDTVLHAFLPWTPYVDGLVVPEQPIHAFAAGMAVDVPTVLGVVHDESVPFIYQAFGKPVDSTGYAVFVGLIFGLDKAGTVLTRYPALNGTDVDQRDRLVELGTEFIFHCPLRNATRGLFSSLKQSNVYQYLYDHPLSFGHQAWGKDFPECAEKVTCHAAELPLVWNSAQSVYPYSDQEIAFAGQLGQYLGNFAWSGNPNKGPVGPKLGADASSAPAVEWPEFWTRGQQLTLKPDAIEPTDKFTAQCDFWDSVGYIM
jgi:acetylcholinesterase/cholinesterase